MLKYPSFGCISDESILGPVCDPSETLLGCRSYLPRDCRYAKFCIYFGYQFYYCLGK